MMDLNMGDSIPELGLDTLSMDQLAFVVEDVDDWMERLGKICNIQPWEVFRAEPPKLTEGTYHGENAEFSMYLAHGYAGDTMIELIQPLEGPTIYQDFLDEHGEGFHHIGCFSWGEEETYEIVELFEEYDMPVIQSANYGGADFWYFDTFDELNGVYLETAVRHKPVAEARTPAYTYPE